MTVEAPAQTAPTELSIGPTIDKLFALREQKRTLDAEMKVIEAKYSELEQGLIAQLDRDGVSKATGRKATASVTEKTIGTAEDWDVLWPWIAKTKNFQLVQRRLSTAAWEELAVERGKKIPGTAPFTKRTLNLRTLS